MSAQIVLLRGINLGPKRRVPMPALRELLTGAGMRDVRTYVASGNVVLSSRLAPERLARNCEALIANRFGFDVGVITRTRDELAQVIERDPLKGLVENPKLYQVAFLSAEPEPQWVERLTALAAGRERLVASGRELYCWYPDGVARSKLAAAVARPAKGPTVTARNWNTVLALLELADGL